MKIRNNKKITPFLQDPDEDPGNLPEPDEPSRPVKPEIVPGTKPLPPTHLPKEVPFTPVPEKAPILPPEITPGKNNNLSYRDQESG